MSSSVDDFKPGIYKHYRHTEKDPKYYQVLGVARNTETDELYALYIPLYTVEDFRGVRFQVRPLDMFLENVEHDGAMMPRFEYIGQQL